MMVAVYCRVSTGRPEQSTSFENQQSYFQAYIRQHPEWTLYQIYADEGITGTSVSARPAFQQMLRDAEAGRFGLILTKEISRFSRNLLDTIACTRFLREMGVGVLFLGNGIHTLRSDGELQLALFASIAQEESRAISARVKWGQTRQMEKGVVFGRSLLGYRVQNGQLHIEPAEAEVVRLIFHKYVTEQKGTTVIARELQKAGVCNGRGSTVWSPGYIRKILRNEKYAGDLVQKKTFTPDYLTHARRSNHGEEPLIRLTGHHEAIVERAMWDAAQQERVARRRTADHAPGRRFFLSGKVKCGLCGGNFVARTRYRKQGPFRCWCCAQAVQSRCGNRFALRESTARDILRQTIAAACPDVSSICAKAAGLAALPQPPADGAQRQAQKIRRVVDLYADGQIDRAELDALLEIYRRQQQAQTTATAVQTPETLQQTAQAWLSGEADSDTLYKAVLAGMTVHPARVEVRLNGSGAEYLFVSDA
ncbi:MAG: recombinase family protein [Clostridia bacterium]|nr:recombinase family protein [Clostridia bacterium]